MTDRAKLTGAAERVSSIIAPVVSRRPKAADFVVTARQVSAATFDRDRKRRNCRLSSLPEDPVHNLVDAPEAAAKPLQALTAGVARLHSLPMLPEACISALTLIKDPDTPLANLVRVIQRDAALTSGILRMANSPLYRIGRELSRLDQAVVRLGLGECQNLVMMVALRGLQQRMPAKERPRFDTLWRHAFTTACLARRLNNELKLGFAGEEFSCGLCHDLGRILLAVCAPAFVAAADPLDFVEDEQILSREADILGLDHCILGALFAELNHLPEGLAAAIRFHHAPQEEKSCTRLVSLIALADGMANLIQRQVDFAAFDPEINRGWQHLVLVLDDLTQHRFRENAGRIFEMTVTEVESVVPFSI
jgi:HD-like signal output (HDOD) protein